jgi:hypothetical protein
MEFEKTMPSYWKSENGAVELKDRWEAGGAHLSPQKKVLQRDGLIGAFRVDEDI